MPPARRRPRWNPRQYVIDWKAATTPPAAVEALPLAPVRPPQPGWDFRTTFPPVPPEAIDAGVLAPEDADPENLAGLHAAHAAPMRQALADLDRLHDARRRGVDPATGRVPRQLAKRDEMPAKLGRDIERVGRWWQTLLDTYGEAFGDAAAEAFGRHVRAAHAEQQPDPEPEPRPPAVKVRGGRPRRATAGPRPDHGRERGGAMTAGPAP